MEDDEKESLDYYKYDYEWTCEKCGCHNYEQDGMAWLENRKICTNCRTVVQSK